MKAVACLLFFSLAGLVSTQYAFKAGNRYVYQVRGRLATGISDINTQYAGLEVTYKIALQVVSPTTIVLKPLDFKAVEWNSELDGGWREAELENETPVEIKGELLKYLESPIEMTMRQGLVESIKVEDYLPTWAVNIKKAQASHFALDTTGEHAVLTGNLNRKTNSVRPEEENTDSGFFYEVMENTILGECETYYTISQQGPFQAPYPIQRDSQIGEQESSEEDSAEKRARRESSEEDSTKQHKPYGYQEYANYEEQQAQEQKHEEAYQKKYFYAPDQQQQEEGYRYYKPQAYQQYNAYKQAAQTEDSESAEDSRETRDGQLPWPQTFDTFCNSNDQIYEIVKSVNFSACSTKPTLSYTTSSQIHARGGDNTQGTAFDRAVITRYLACGKDRKQFTILSIKQEEQFNFGLRLTQKTVAGTRQNITLISVTKARQSIKVQSPKVIDDLSYTFDPQEQRLQKEGQIQHGYNDDRNDNDSSEEDTPLNNRRRSQNDDSDSDSKESQEKYGRRQEKHSRRPRAAQDSSSESEESEETQQKNQEWFRYDTEAEGKGQLPKPSLKRAPVNPYLSSPLQTSGLKKRIQELMKEIVDDILTDKQSMAESETLSKISTVAKILRYLNYEDVEELYHQIAAKDQTEEDQTNRNVFLDAVAIAGTNPNIHFLIDLIQKKEIVGEHAAQMIATFPMYIRTPTEQMLKVMFDRLTDSSAIENEKEQQVKTAAILAMSNILYEACVNTRIGDTKYPVQIYGEFCDEKLVRRQYVPFFIENLKKHMESNEQSDKHWVSTYLAALGNLGVRDVIPVVQQILDDEVDPYYKVKAVFALKHLCVSRSAQNVPVTEVRGVDRQAQDLLTDDLIEKEVLPILMAASFDKSEHPEVRMAALSLIIYTTSADVTIWQQMAFSTWNAASQEVHSFIFSTLKNLAELKRPLNAIHQKMAIKARAVLSLAKPFAQGHAKSKNIFSSAWMEHIQTGYLQHAQFFGSKDSIVPNYMYLLSHLTYANGAQGATPIEVDIQGQTIQRLADYMVDQFVKKTSESEPHQELDEIHNILGISQREQEEKPEASIRINLRQQMERMWSINEEAIQQLIAKAKGELLPKLLNGIPFNYQKTLHLMEHSMEMPSVMGIPCHYHIRMPLHVSLRGTVKLVNKDGLKDVQLQAEIHPVYAWKTHGKLAFKVPFSGKAYQAGVMRHAVIETPLRALIRWAPEGHAVFAISPAPLATGTPAGEIDVFTFHQKPYTAIITDECWPTVHKEGGKMEIVHAVEEPYKNSQVFESVQKAFGLTLQLEEETEYHDQNETPSGWMRFFKRFHTPGCWFNVGWLGAENVRYVQRKVTLDISKSDSKTLGFVVAYNKRDNPTARDLWGDSSSQSSQSSEESASSESAQDSSSQQNDSASAERRQPTRGDRRRSERNERKERNSNEDEFDTGRVVAVALIGKRAPIKSVQENRGQIQKILSKENPSTIQYLAQFSKSTGRVYVRIASGDSANEAAEALPKSHSSLVVLREIIADSQNQKAQPDYCTEFEGEYDAPKHANRHELIVLRKRLLSEDLTVKVKGEIQFGTSCSKMPHEIKVKGELKRGPKMTEWAKKDSPEAKKCIEDEKKGFSISPICLWVAEQQAAALNQATLKITYSPNLPVELKNRTMDVEDFVKAYLYPYLSHDQYHEGAGTGQIQVDAHMLPNKEFVDVTITKSHSRLSFRSMKTSKWAKAFLPLTATQSLPNNIRDRILRVDSEVSCSIEGNTVNTFDNVTYRFHNNVADDCYQVLAKDCSGREPVAVLLKDATAQKKEVVLLLGGQTKIELNQQAEKSSGLYGSRKVDVQVNEQRVESLPRRIFAKDSGKEIARIEAMQDGGVQVISKQFQVATNGKYVHVQTVNSLRNRTCGLCGDFDGEKIGEFRGPRDCALSSGSLLVASYSFQSVDKNEKAQCKINENAKKQLKHEQELCLRSAVYQPNQPRMSAGAGQVEAADEQCVKKFEQSIRQTVFDVVNAVLKPFEWLTQSRERMVHSLADSVMNKVREIISQVRNVKELSEKVQEYVCEEAKKLKTHSLAIDAVCKSSKGLQIQAYKYALNPIAERSQCVAPSKKDFNPAEAAKQVQYALEDESEHDDSPVPWIPAHKLPMPCNQKLEEILSKSVSKYAYYLLFLDFDMSEMERLKITNAVNKAVRQAVQTTLAANNIDRLDDEILKNVREVFPAGRLQKIMDFFIKRYTPFTLVKLCKLEKCCWKSPVPSQHQQQESYPGQYGKYDQAEKAQRQQQRQQRQQQPYAKYQ